MIQPVPPSVRKVLSGPIRGPDPAKDVRSQTQWGVLIAVDSVIGAKPWEATLQAGVELLREQGWDTRVLNLTTQALLHLHGTEGWTQGLEVWERVLGEAWPALGPAGEGARAGGAAKYMAAMRTWVLSQAPEELGREQALPTILEALRRLEKGCDRLQIGQEGRLIPAIERLETVLETLRTTRDLQGAGAGAGSEAQGAANQRPDAPAPASEGAAEGFAAHKPSAGAQPPTQAVGVVSGLGSGAGAHSGVAQGAGGPQQRAEVQPGAEVQLNAGTPDPDASPKRVLQDFYSQRKAVATLCMRLQRADPACAAPYQILRAWHWSNVSFSAPASSGPNRVASPPSVSEPARKRLATAAQSTDPLAALHSAEELWISSGLCWLDPQRVVATSLRRLGHSEAAEAVESMTLAFVRRFPGLEEVRFTDGSGLADPETRSWLTGLRSPSTTVGAPSPAAPPATPLPSLPAGPAPAAGAAAVLRACETSLRAGRAQEAALVLDAALRQTASGREQFELRLGFAHLLLETGRGQAAGPVLQELDEVARSRELDRWDPELAAQLLRGLLRWNLAQRPAPAEALASIRRRASALGALHLLLE